MLKIYLILLFGIFVLNSCIRNVTEGLTTLGRYYKYKGCVHLCVSTHRSIYISANTEWWWGDPGWVPGVTKAALQSRLKTL